MGKTPLTYMMTVQQYQMAQHNTVITKQYQTTQHNTVITKLCLTEVRCIQLNTAHNIVNSTSPPTNTSYACVPQSTTKSFHPQIILNCHACTHANQMSYVRCLT